MRRKDYANHEPRSNQLCCPACNEKKTLKRNSYIKKYRAKKRGGNNKIQKLAHDEVVSVPSQVNPTMKEDVTSVTLLMEVIPYPKLSTLIINQSQ